MASKPWPAGLWRRWAAALSTGACTAILLMLVAPSAIAIAIDSAPTHQQPVLIDQADLVQQLGQGVAEEEDVLLAQTARCVPRDGSCLETADVLPGCSPGWLLICSCTVCAGSPRAVPP